VTVFCAFAGVVTTSVREKYLRSSDQCDSFLGEGKAGVRKAAKPLPEEGIAHAFFFFRTGMVTTSQGPGSIVYLPREFPLFSLHKLRYTKPVKRTNNAGNWLQP